MNRIDTIIIGSGQAGLATSYHLSQYGREHLILEQTAQVGSVWRNQRWDSFTLVTPNWSFNMPDADHSGAGRDGFMSRDEVVAYFDSFVDRYQPPIQFNTRVLSVEAVDSNGYRVLTIEGTYEANNVVVATGFFQQPKIPTAASRLSPTITQLHSSAYRNPEAISAGAVLVVGSGQSGCQIAEELYKRGRKVYLCTGGAGRIFRRYRGKDAIEWLHLIGFLDAFTEADAADFFGRDTLIATLRQRLHVFPAFLAVIGASGSGKSSVVMGGLISSRSHRHGSNVRSSQVTTR